MPPPNFLAARPTFAVDGAINDELASRLLELEIVARVGEPCRCTARFNNVGDGGFVYFDRHLLEFGKRFSVFASGQTIFDGQIFGLEAAFSENVPANIAVLAGDRLEDLRMVRRTRTFLDASDADVVQRIASDYGLTATVNLSGPTHKVLAQINQTDFAFLGERMTAVDALFWVEGTVLHVSQARAPDAVSPMLILGGNLRQFNVTADLRAQRTELTVASWDVAAKSAIAGHADPSVITGIPDGGGSGPSILSSAFGERRDAIVGAAPSTQDEAQHLAGDAFRRMARRFVSASGVAELDPQLQAGAEVKFMGVGALFSGAYDLTEVIHVFDTEGGLRTEFTAECASLSPI